MSSVTTRSVGSSAGRETVGVLTTVVEVPKLPFASESESFEESSHAATESTSKRESINRVERILARLSTAD